MTRRPPKSTLFPYTTSSLSVRRTRVVDEARRSQRRVVVPRVGAAGARREARRHARRRARAARRGRRRTALRSEEHTSELQSRQYLVCRLLLEKKKKK